MGFANVEFRADSEDNTVTVTLNHPAAGHGGYTLSDRLDLDQTAAARLAHAATGRAVTEALGPRETPAR